MCHIEYGSGEFTYVVLETLLRACMLIIIRVDNEAFNQCISPITNTD